MTGVINGLSPFGEYVKLKLMALNKTQRWLAEMVGIKESHLSQMVRGIYDYPEKATKVREFLEAFED